ncbi:MAG: response regulator transcription factor [Oscillospiraceae bacterium]|nr:response regulator transcription factor [Oscillospiraceae bacterium]
MKILLLEDEADIRRAVSKALTKQGYLVDEAEDGKQALLLFDINEYDLLVLDLNVPLVHGLAVLQSVRASAHEQKSKVPVLILSAMGEWDDKVKGLDLGANDYLAKPFHIEELLARVRANIRAASPFAAQALQAGGLVLSMAKRQACAGGVPLALTRKEYDILEYLLLHKGSVCTETDLLEHAWASDADMFSNAVKVHISSLRKKLAAAGEAERVRTVRGHGYMIA